MFLALLCFFLFVLPLDMCCAPDFQKNTKYGEDKKEMIGKASGDKYTWSDEQLVPPAYKFNDLLINPTLSGDGYSVLIPNNRSRALKLIQKLREDEWIDLCTRAIFLEFTVVNDYQAMVGLFRATIETPSAGFVIPSEEITVSRHRNGTWDNTVDIVLLIFFVLLFYTEIEDMCCRSWRYSFRTDAAQQNQNLGQFIPNNAQFRSYYYQYRLSGSYGAGYYRTTDKDKDAMKTSARHGLKEDAKNSMNNNSSPSRTTKKPGNGMHKKTKKTLLQHHRHDVTSTAFLRRGSVEEESIFGIGGDLMPRFYCWNCTKCICQRSQVRVPRYLWMLYTNTEDILQTLLVVAAVWTIYARIDVAFRETSLSREVLLGQSAFKDDGTAWFSSESFYLVAASNRLQAGLAVCLFITIINMLFKLSFFRGIALFTIIIEAMYLKLRSFSVVLFVVALGFATLAWILFGQAISSYSTPFGSLMSMIGGGTIQGLGQWDATDQFGKLNGGIFHLVFIFSFVVLLMNLLIAVMTEGYEEMRNRAAETWAFSQFKQWQEVKLYGSPRRSIVALCCLCYKRNEETQQRNQALRKNKVSADEFKQDIQKMEIQNNLDDLLLMNGGDGGGDGGGARETPSSFISLVLLSWYNSSRRSIGNTGSTVDSDSTFAIERREVFEIEMNDNSNSPAVLVTE